MRTVRTCTREHVWLWWEFELAGGQSGPGGRTVRHTNQICTRDLWRLWWKSKLKGGRSAPWARTVHRSFQVLYQRGCFSGLGLMVERRTVRPWGADGPLANFKVVPEMMFVSGGVEHITVDGPPLGSGRSARAPTASSDTMIAL